MAVRRFDARRAATSEADQHKHHSTACDSTAGGAHTHHGHGGGASWRAAESATVHLSLGGGGLLAVNFVPEGPRPLYGPGNPIGAMGFVRLKLD